MPGRLIMNQQGAANASPDLNKDRSQAQIGGGGQKRDFSQMQATAHSKAGANGFSNGPLSNGASAQHQTLPSTNGHSNGATTSVPSLPTPPPLDQSWRTSDSNKPMGVMLTRLAQQCFGDLNDTLNKMNEMPAPQPAAAKGLLPHTADQSQASVDRKRVLMEFASGQRDRFIKALVLSDWARSEEDMAKLVDLKVWRDKQEIAQFNAMRFIGTTKHDLARAKMPNPNIEGAMELLAMGKAPGWPDLGYLPPAKLTAKQLIGTLHNMNVAIATRLNLHEELPPHFRDFSIANGRATFYVPGEFEVDLSVADEDPASQFYLIDLRFTFTPTPSLSDDVLRNALEAQTNESLKSAGLSGCYEFLHNFVLTHKINVLKSQAVQLFRQKWFGCLLTETHRRVFAVQYWKDQAGKKSWIEFGISTGKAKGRQPRKAATSQHSIRWFRQGQEVQDDTIAVDWDNLDLDAVLSQVTAKHASWLLSTIHARLQTLAGTHSKLDAHLNTSDVNVDACKLTLSMPGLLRPLTVQVEPVTGLVSISPATRDTAVAERMLNQPPAIDKSGSIAALLCRAVQDRVRKTATSCGWQLADLRGWGPQPNLKTLFGQDFARHDIFLCHRGWGEKWALCTTYSLSGQKWWILRLNKQVGEQGRSVKTIARAQVLEVAASALSRADTLRIENVAEAEVSFAVLTHELTANQIPHQLEKLAPLTQDGDSAGNNAAMAVYVRLTSKDLRKSGLSRYRSLAMTNWIKIAYRGVISADSEDAETRHDIRLTVDSGKLRPLREHLTKSSIRDADVAMSASGGLALSLRTPFGKPYIEEIGRLLERCEELSAALASMRSLQFISTTIGLNKLAFTYGPSHQYNATLVTNGAPTSLKLGPSSSNPHHRVRVHLEKIYNTTETGPFGALAFAMIAAQPLLEALSDLEGIHAAHRTATIHAHDAFGYSIVYHAPVTPCRFKVQVTWLSKEGSAKVKEYRYNITPWQKEGVELPSDFSDALIDLSKDSGSKAEGWFGNNKGGYTADIKGLPAALRRLDDFVRNSEKNTDAVQQQEQLETPLPKIKRTLSRDPSKSNVAPEKKATSSAQQKSQQKAQQKAPQKAPQKAQQNQTKQNPKAQESTARQMTVTATHGQRQNPHAGGKLKQEIIELD